MPVQRRTSLFILAALIIGSAWVSAPALAQDQDTWNKNFTVTGRVDLRIDTNDGHVRVDTWDRNEVGVRITARGWSVGPSGNVKVTESQTGNRIDLNVRVATSVWHFNVQNRSLHIEVNVPRQTDLTTNSGDGHIQANGIEGTLNLRTEDGHITLSRIRGGMTLHTEDGRIEGDSLDGPLEAETGDGNIRVSGRFTTLNLRSGDGTINAEASAESKITTGWSLRTDDGGIRLRVPRDIKADLEASTGDGRIYVDVPVETVGTLSRREVRGKINGGGLPLRLRTGDGGITINGQ